MARYRARDVEELRRLMATPRREVPHSVRSLARKVGTNHSTVGYLLTGDRTVVDEKVARGIADEYGCAVGDLFLLEPSPSEDEDERGEA
jgi:transcriptional regulator with XRE-family HTH domain